MTFEELIAAFAATYGIEGLEAGNGTATLDVDGMEVSILYDGPANTVTLCGEIGEPPATAEGRFGEVMLQANFLFGGTEGATLAQDPETRAFAIVRALELPGLDPDAFSEAVERFVNQLERWKRLLADFRPIMLQEAQPAETEESRISMMLDQRFLKV